MGLTEAILGILLGAGPFIAGWALLIMYLSEPNFRFARQLFWLSALPMGLFTMIWDVTSDTGGPLRVVATIAMFAVTATLLSEALRWAYRHELNGTTPSTVHVTERLKEAAKVSAMAKQGDTYNVTSSGSGIAIGRVGTLNITNEDKSTKAQLRKLFEAVDRRSLAAIDSGQNPIRIRLIPYDVDKFEKLLREPGSDKLITGFKILRRFTDSVIDNGTLGPTGAEPDQYELEITFSEAMRGD